MARNVTDVIASKHRDLIIDHVFKGKMCSVQRIAYAFLALLIGLQVH